MVRKVLIITATLFFLLNFNLFSETRNFLGKKVEIIPISEIKPGMVGYGLSDFGTGVKKFNVKILTVNQWIANKKIIWAKIWGGPDNIVSRAGVIAGMSGSPIYLLDKNGKYRLIGALAYGYPFQPPKEAIAGITPIDEMLSLPNYNYTGGYDYSAIKFPNYKSSSLLMPLIVSGGKEAIAAFQKEVKLPFKYIVSTPSPNSSYWKSPRVLRAGEAVSVALSIGDFTVVATGTVTIGNKKGFLAFGHPFFLSGKSNLPVYAAKIGTVIPNILTSFKMNEKIGKKQIGILKMDGWSGIFGLWDQRETMVPWRMKVITHRINGKTESKYKQKIALRNIYTDRIIYYSLLYFIQLSSLDVRNSLFSIKATIDYWLPVPISGPYGFPIIFSYGNGERKMSYRKKFYIISGGKYELMANFYQFIDAFNVLQNIGAAIENIEIDIDIKRMKKPMTLKCISLDVDDIDKDQVRPGNIIVIKIILGNKKKIYKRRIPFIIPKEIQNYKKEKIELKEGKIEIKAQDFYNRLTALINKAEKSKKYKDMMAVLDFLNPKSKISINDLFVETDITQKSTPPQESLTQKGQSFTGWVSAELQKKKVSRIIRKIKLPVCLISDVQDYISLGVKK